MKKTITILLACVLALSLGAADLTHITILGTSDMHANIIGWSYEDGKATTNNGMARLYTYIQGVREENPNTILIDAGDYIQGTIMADDLYNKRPDEENPVIAAMNKMGYTSVTLGNHEFNKGITTLRKLVAQADFPVLAANITDKDGNYLTGKGYVVTEVAGVKIAIIGVDTPNIPIWDSSKEGIQETVFGSASVAVTKALEEIGDEADVIVVSAHLGLEPEFDYENGADSAWRILEDNPDVDVLQVAHYHVDVKDQKGKTVIGGVRNAGRAIARFDLYVDESGNVVESTVQIVDMAGVNPSDEIINLPIVQKSHQETNEYIYGNILAESTARFQPENEIRGIPEGRLRDTALIDIINQAMLDATGADVSCASLFKTTSDLPEGSITYANIFDIYKYDNALYRVPVTGAELKAHMEWTVETYNQWVPGDISISFDGSYADYLYDMFAGVDYEIDLSQPKGSRIKNVMYKGEPLKDDERLLLAVCDYRYNSTLKKDNIVAATKDWESSDSVRAVLVDYFKANSPLVPVVDNNWRIVGIDLSEDDPRRAELIALINEGKLDPPYNHSYNLADYDELIALAESGIEGVDLASFNH